jgi:hypothetical protein
LLLKLLLLLLVMNLMLLILLIRLVVYEIQRERHGSVSTSTPRRRLVMHAQIVQANPGEVITAVVIRRIGASPCSGRAVKVQVDHVYVVQVWMRGKVVIQIEIAARVLRQIEATTGSDRYQIQHVHIIVYIRVVDEQVGSSRVILKQVVVTLYEMLVVGITSIAVDVRVIIEFDYFRVDLGLLDRLEDLEIADCLLGMIGVHVTLSERLALEHLAAQLTRVVQVTVGDVGARVRLVREALAAERAREHGRARVLAQYMLLQVVLVEEALVAQSALEGLDERFGGRVRLGRGHHRGRGGHYIRAQYLILGRLLLLQLYLLNLLMLLLIQIIQYIVYLVHRGFGIRRSGRHNRLLVCSTRVRRLLNKIVNYFSRLVVVTAQLVSYFKSAQLVIVINTQIRRIIHAHHVAAAISAR